MDARTVLDEILLVDDCELVDEMAEVDIHSLFDECTVDECELDDCIVLNCSPEQDAGGQPIPEDEYSDWACSDPWYMCRNVYDY